MKVIYIRRQQPVGWAPGHFSQKEVDYFCVPAKGIAIRRWPDGDFDLIKDADVEHLKKEENELGFASKVLAVKELNLNVKKLNRIIARHKALRASQKAYEREKVNFNKRCAGVFRLRP